MDGRFSDSPNSSPDDAGIATPTAELKPSSSPKRSRRSTLKRVVTVPIADTDRSRHKGGGEGAPPSDSWAWRKYGQKPIKGSPYPRGYYRCSSSKGCPARKQVERSRVDPTVLVVTYAGEHNHPWPRPKGQSQSTNANTKPIPSPSRSAEDENPAAMMSFSNRDPADRDDRFSDLIGEDSGLLDYGWFADVGSPCSASPSPATDDFLLGPIACSADVAIPFADEIGIRVDEEEEEEEDSLFAGLGELPEFSVVLRRCGVAASR